MKTWQKKTKAASQEINDSGYSKWLYEKQMNKNGVILNLTFI